MYSYVKKAKNAFCLLLAGAVTLWLWLLATDAWPFFLRAKSVPLLLDSPSRQLGVFGNNLPVSLLRVC
jgi:hypothetical protein